SEKGIATLSLSSSPSELSPDPSTSPASMATSPTILRMVLAALVMGSVSGIQVRCAPSGQEFRPETVREQLGDGLLERRAVDTVGDHHDVWICELPNALAAAAARSHRHISRACDIDAADTSPPAGDHRGNGGCLRAIAHRVGGVLDVATDID